MSTAAEQLSSLDQSVWIDFLSRAALRDGTIERLIRDDSVVGLTSNPSIFHNAMAHGDAYDEQLHELLSDGTDPKEVFLALAQHDIRDACDLLRQTWERTDLLDGQVSLEVDPRFAYDREATIAEAARLHELVDRQNLYVKIPATEPGLEAIEGTIAAGIPVNVTLIFSLERHRAVIEAYTATITDDLDAARQLLADLRTAGVDYDEVTAALEEAGVQTFLDAFKALFDGIETKRGTLATQR